ncbi:uncharacterized protein [Montipora foliosa]|uniref:uncharacterized protein n=1 Tax=Montipora foliosa TaxID=591990 RepID=UPI0035F179A4
MSGQSHIMPALGRPFDLGMLYDRRSEKLILGKTLWSPDLLSQAVNVIPTPYTNSEVLTGDTIDDRALALDVEANLKLSFLGGLVDVRGAAKYLDDRKTSSRHSRVVLKYETTTELKQLTMENLGRKKVQYPEVFHQDIATDVVVGILYGARAFLIFDQEVSKDESLAEVHENMEVLVKALPDVSVDGNGFVNMSEEQKKKTKAMGCTMYGDFRTDESPTTYEEAVRVYKRLPSLIGDKGQSAVAVHVYLRPLSEVDSKGQQMVREISANYISKTCEIQEHIHWIEAQCRDLMREDVCSSFPKTKMQLTSFKDNISRYRNFFRRKLLFLLPSIRGGGAEESALGDIFQEKQSSPFAKSHLDAWIEEKRKEMKRLQGMITSLGDTPFVEDVENESFNLSNEHIVCCTFKIGKKDDPQILSMDKYLTGKGPAELKTGASKGIEDKSFNKRIRQTLRQFAELKVANKDHKEVKFVATEECLSDNFSGNLGAFVYLYEDGDLVDDDFKSSPKPEKLEAKNVQDDSIELRWNDQHFSQNKIKKYKVQYKKDEEASSDWITQYSACGNEPEQNASVSGLQPATKYSFRVCAMGQIVVSQYSNTLCETTKPTSPPGKPFFAAAATADHTITIAFTKPKNVGMGIEIEKYKIECNTNSPQMEQISQYTEDASLTCTIRGLQAGVPYKFRVIAICGSKGESGPSELSDPLQILVPPKKFDAIKILAHCDVVQPPVDGKPAVYSLPLKPVHKDSSSQLRKFVISLKENRRQSPSSSQSILEKVVMFVGSTGSGKTTTVNAMINHVLGVEWMEDFRFKMIHHELSGNQGAKMIGNQAHSQTQFVTCYTLPCMKGFKFPYNLTVVDTPGFGDTRGIERDKAITEQIRRFFNTEGSAGIDHVDAICFVAQAGNPRLTPTQQYVFDRILSIFGKDIRENILVLFTFADGQRPQALSAMLEAGILENESHFFKFNNSALFVANSGEDDKDNFDRMFWKMGVKSFEKFFTGLAQMEPKSLILTKQVLSERAQLDVRLSGLREKIELGVNELSKMEQLTRTFNQHAADINANRNFKFSVQEPRRKQIQLETGTYTTNCVTCNYTCHYPCKIPKSEDKRRCAAMEGTESCTQCPNECHWSNHVNDRYRFETEYITVEKEYDEIKDRYVTAVQGQTKVEAVMKQLEEEFNSTNEIVLNFVAEMQRGLKKLSEIALKKDPLEQVDYLDLLIESEKSQAKPGWQDRVKSLQKTRQQAVEINRLRKPGFDPWEKYRENEETRQFFERRTEAAQGTFLSKGFKKAKKFVFG